MKIKSKIIYSLATQHDNVGDQIINRELLLYLNNKYSVFIEDKGVPDWFFNKMIMSGVEKTSADSKKYSIKSLGYYLHDIFRSKTFDAIMLSPGHFGGSNFKKDIRKFVILAISIYFRLKGISVCRLGISFETMTFCGRLIESLSAMSFDVYGVRDTISRDALLGFGKKTCDVLPDLSFLAYKKIKTFPVNFHKENILLVSFRGDRRHPDASKKYEKSIYYEIPSNIAEVYNSIVCYSQVIYDKNETYSLKKLFESRGCNVNLQEEYKNIDKAITIISGADVVVSNRLHVLLPAMMLGTLAIAVGSSRLDSKISSIYGDMDLSDLFFDVEENSNFKSYLSKIMGEKKIILKRVKIALLRQHLKLTSQLDAIFSI